MKQIYFIVMYLAIILLFCSCNTELETREIENTASIDSSINSTLNEYKTDIITSSETETINNKSCINKIFQALIDKNEEDLWRIGYVEGEDGFLYSVDFDSYEILNSSSYQRNDMVEVLEYSVELVVSKSSDSRFPVGTSTWNVGISDAGYCTYFLPETADKQQISEYWNNEFAQIGRLYTFSFDENRTIEDTRKLPEVVGKETFLDGVETFLIGIKPELGNGGAIFVEKNVVDETLKQYFGIVSYIWDDNVSGIQCDSNYWQIETVYALINEQDDEYIEVTYYADFAYITPAYKIRYYFNNKNNPSNLTAVELLEDYGHKPFTEMF